MILSCTIFVRPLAAPRGRRSVPPPRHPPCARNDARAREQHRRHHTRSGPRNAQGSRPSTTARCEKREISAATPPRCPARWRDDGGREVHQLAPQHGFGFILRKTRSSTSESISRRRPDHIGAAEPDPRPPQQVNLLSVTRLSEPFPEAVCANRRAEARSAELLQRSQSPTSTTWARTQPPRQANPERLD